MAAAPNKQTIRIQRDLDALAQNPLDFVQNLQLTMEDGLHVLTCILLGPKESPYEGGRFEFVISFPKEYPFRQPDFVFKTKISHPNIHSVTGTACPEQMLATWAPHITLSKIFTEIHQLLAQPCYENPIQGDIATEKSPEQAKQWTEEFAHSA